MPNSLVVKLRERGGNLVVTIPRQLVRELGLGERDYMRIFRSGPRALTITPAEVRLRERSELPEHPTQLDSGTGGPVTGGD